MVYTKKTPWVLIIGIIMAGYAWLVASGTLAGTLEFLHTKGKANEMVTMGYIFGGIGIVVGLWQLFITPKQGSMDYYLSTVGGALLILMCVFVVKYGAEPLFKHESTIRKHDELNGLTPLQKLRAFPEFKNIVFFDPYS